MVYESPHRQSRWSPPVRRLKRQKKKPAPVAERKVSAAEAAQIADTSYVYNFESSGTDPHVHADDLHSETA